MVAGLLAHDVCQHLLHLYDGRRAIVPTLEDFIDGFEWGATTEKLVPRFSDGDAAAVQQHRGVRR